MHDLEKNSLKFLFIKMHIQSEKLFPHCQHNRIPYFMLYNYAYFKFLQIENFTVKQLSFPLFFN